MIGTGRKEPPAFYNKNCSWKFRNLHRKIPLLEFLFNKALESNFNKKKSQHRCILVNIVELLRLPVSKSICERLLLSDLFWHDQFKSNFCASHSSKLPVPEQRFKNNLKDRESQKNTFFNSHIYNVYVMITMKSRGFTPRF